MTIRLFSSGQGNLPAVRKIHSRRFHQWASLQRLRALRSPHAAARFEVGEREQALADWERALSELRATGPAEAIPRALAGSARAP